MPIMKLSYSQPEVQLQVIYEENLIAVSELGGDTEGLGDISGESSFYDVNDLGDISW